MPRFVRSFAALLGAALFSSGCQTDSGSIGGQKSTGSRVPAAETGGVSAGDLASPEVVRSKLKATQLEVLKVESFIVMPAVTQHDGAGNRARTHVTIELLGRPYYATSTVTSAQLRFLPSDWGGLSRPAYVAGRNRIVADHPLAQAEHFYQIIKDGKEVLCLFVHSDAFAKSECYLFVYQKK